jgi:outer membrane protein, multidrug efflux system
MTVRLGAALLLITLLPSCATAPPPSNSATPVPPAWLGAGGATPVERDWWRGFADPVLDTLIDEALKRNLDLRQATARLAEAGALAQAQHGAALPSLDLIAGAARSRSLSEVAGQPYFSTGHQSQFQAAYEVDLWGRVAALNAAADAGTQAGRVARDAVALSVAASTASGYFNLRAIDAQLDLAQRTLISREKSLALIRSRHERGYASALELAQAEAELRATAQAIPQWELAAQRQERALNVLLARPPGPIDRGAPLLSLIARGLPQAGVPSELLRRRPDIVSAELQVAAADAQWAAARAQMLPSLRISATLGSVGSSALRGDPFGIWSLGGSVLAPIFNGGRLRSLTTASASRREQALIAYERVVLTSFAEVENQLSAFRLQREQLQQAEAQQVAVESALRIAGRRYREGYASYLDELLAQRNLFAVEQQVLQLRTDLLVTDVNLYRALGGGWDRAANVLAPMHP